MKPLLYTLSVILFLASCEKDNYVAPGATVQGTIVDPDGNPVQLEQGASSMRIRMHELSWSDTPIPTYLNVRQDGSYVNTKIFSGNYRMLPVEGPFYPIAEDAAKIIDIAGNTTVDFTVVPYLNVEWVSGPEVTADKKIRATFRFSRNPAPSGMTQPNLLDYQLFISTTQYVGNNNWDATVVGAVVPVGNDKAGQELTIVSSAPMKYATTFYVRVGVRVNDSFKKYNYTDVKAAVVQ